MALTAFAMTSVGVLVAASIEQMESFQAIMQFLVMPMFFLSGALFPSSGLPSWLAALETVNPLSYAVDPMRRVIFSSIAAPGPAAPGLAWGGWTVTTPVELGVLLVVGVACLALAMVRFERVE